MGGFMKLTRRATIGCGEQKNKRKGSCDNHETMLDTGGRRRPETPLLTSVRGKHFAQLPRRFFYSLLASSQDGRH